MKRARLEEFRQAAYTHLGKAHDATFELTDAILLTRNVYLYRQCLDAFDRVSLEAIQDTKPDRDKLMELYLGADTNRRACVVGGRSYSLVAFDAVTLKERTIEHTSECDRRK